MSNYEKKLSTT